MTYYYIYNTIKKQFVLYSWERNSINFVNGRNSATIFEKEEAMALIKNYPEKLKKCIIQRASEKDVEKNLTGEAEKKEESSRETPEAVVEESKKEPKEEPKEEPKQATQSEKQEDVVARTPRRLFTKKERMDIYVRDEGRCGICGTFLAPNNFTIDHITPISKGGTYDYENLQCCCGRCNLMKADALPDDFLDVVVNVLEYQVEKKNKKIMKKIKKISKKVKNKAA